MTAVAYRDTVPSRVVSLTARYTANGIAMDRARIAGDRAAYDAAVEELIRLIMSDPNILWSDAMKARSKAP